MALRDKNRRLLRDSVVSAARDLTIARGWDAVRMADVAEAAGVSRQTLYNEFEGKAGLAHALAAREIERFLAAVRHDLAEHGGDVRAAGRAAILHVLSAAAENPLIKAILTSAHGGADDLLPFLTTRADLVLGAAGDVLREWAGTHLPGLDDGTVAVAAETIARLTVSHVVLPSAPPEPTADALAEVLVRLLRPASGA
jgi:AcrR family transcriptional regulator